MTALERTAAAVADAMVPGAHPTDVARAAIDGLRGDLLELIALSAVSDIDRADRRALQKLLAQLLADDEDVPGFVRPMHRHRTEPGRTHAHPNGHEPHYHSDESLQTVLRRARERAEGSS